LLFWINLYLGIFFALFALGIFYYYYRQKSSTDKVYKQLGDKLGLKVKKSSLAYPSLEGLYQGREVIIKVDSQIDPLGETPQNFTVLKLRHNLSVKKKQAIDSPHLQELFPDLKLELGKKYLTLSFPAVIVDPELLKSGLDLLIKEVESLEKI